MLGHFGLPAQRNFAIGAKRALYGGFVSRAREGGAGEQLEFLSVAGDGGGEGELPVGRTAEWTFGGAKKNLQMWKGQPAKNVIGVFGNPDKGVPWGQGGGAWTYQKMKITDAQGNLHSSVTFYMQKGQVVNIKLP